MRITRGHRTGRNRRSPAMASGESAHGGGVWRLARLAAALATAAALVMVVHYGWQSLRTSSRLNVETIELVGATRVKAGEIQAYTNIGVGDSILEVDLDAAALSLRRHPWIQTARLQRKLPDRIIITVDEFEPAIVVALGELYLADATGQLFKRLSSRDAIVLPVITGVHRGDATDTPAAVAEIISAGVALAVAFENDGDNLGRLEELHWDEDLGWTAVTQPARAQQILETHLGFGGLSRIDHAKTALATLTARGQRPVTLWVDGVKDPRRVFASLLKVAQPKEEHETLIAEAR
ncbi:MAG: hypothetical protein A2289_10140 [Deltaproteobacteria bacterium RIFOXYA12_FULL_58_15]|nr:MAG: hypothetical protein A2289_10140 [Deltaproteobacteria bacterium RIFOXYA12_FULL_58_15]